MKYILTIGDVMIMGVFPMFSSFLISSPTALRIALLLAGSRFRKAPVSVCFTLPMTSCSIFGSSVSTLVVSWEGKYLVEIALFKLCLTYSVRISVSLVVGA